MVLFASDFDKSKYLRAEDLKQEKKFRIKNVTVETLGQDDGKEKKLVIWLTNDERGLVLNKTNNRTIRGAFGDALEGWTGKVIIVFPTMADFRGKLTPALRVRIPPPKQATEATTPQQPTSPAGNGAAATAAAADPELALDPVKPLSEDLNDEIPF